MTRISTVEEIKKALFDIGDLKAPGPDGYCSKFYKQAWDIVKIDFVADVLEFFTKGQLLKSWNHTLIALVPKMPHASKVQDYRPISCCNVFYKVISKLLASRLAEVTDYILHPAQAAFVKGRNITDNIHLGQELMRNYTRKRISPRCFMKVDLQKAFDSVHWEFLLDMLMALQFPTNFITWIKECITITTFSITINGMMHGFFKGGRGRKRTQAKGPPLPISFRHLYGVSLPINSQAHH